MRREGGRTGQKTSEDSASDIKTTTRNKHLKDMIAVKGYRIKGRDLEEVLRTIWITLKTQKNGPPA
jgi:hypothetical protein